MKSNMIYELDKGNKIIGNYPEIKNSTIQFLGSNNILYCEKDVKLEDSELVFKANNSVIWLGTNNNNYKLNLTVFNDSVFYMGNNNWISGKITVLLSEQKHCIIGDKCMFATNVFIRNADPHLIYSCASGQRINESKSVFIGDHIWIGQDVRILKGTSIDSGSIVGAMSVVAGKRICHNQVWGGNPSKLIKDNVFWDISCVHDWTEQKTEKSMLYEDYISKYKPHEEKDAYIYEYDANVCLQWSEIEKNIGLGKTPMEKVEYLIGLSKNKNRFVHK